MMVGEISPTVHKKGAANRLRFLNVISDRAILLL